MPNNPEAPTFENTIVAMELTGPLLDKVTSTFGNITGTDTDDELRALETEIYPMLTREYDAIRFNEALYARVKAIYEQKDSLGLDEQDARLLELTESLFCSRRRGAVAGSQATDRRHQCRDVGPDDAVLAEPAARNQGVHARDDRR